MKDLTTPGLPPALSEQFSQLADAFTRLSRRVQEMSSQEELEYVGPAGNVNSTATLVGHITCVDIGYLYAIKGEPVPAEVEATFGPYQTEDGTLPKVTGKSAAELLGRHQQVLEMIREYLQTCSDEDATREVRIAWWPEPATVRYVLWHMAGHAMLHQGQIARLQAWYKERNA